MRKKKILIVDDEILILKILKLELGDSGYNVVLANDGEEAIEKFKKEDFDMVIVDNRMPKKSGIEVIKEIKKIKPNTIILMMTAFGSISNAVEAIKEGAYDYITKPFENNDFMEKIKNILDNQKEIHGKDVDGPEESKKLIGNGKEIIRIKKIIEKIKDLDTIVLLTGESGTGKGVIAREICSRSNRKQMPFIQVDCASLSENLIESELFGHEKGSFTGANETKIGKFESAKNGTIFLDEIGTLDLNLQAKLLIVLQEKSFTRIGSSVPRKLSARVIAATNINLENAVQKKIFREDLFYRLNVVTIECCPLRYRKDEIKELSLGFIKNINKKFKKKILSVSDEVWDLFEIYNWPGNIRELENTLECSIALSSDENLKVNDLPIRIMEKIKYIKRSSQMGESNLVSEDTAKNYEFEEQEIRGLKEALYRNNGHREKTAIDLNIARRTLQYKLKKYGLS
ncbi:sigma-54 dependent transcriptional regulator [Clostridium sp.]|uniref:sigma-54-dependent transcriptional regulator n=1 Tax=Clostridium sp. TaxID=1506 RepID=UPI001A4C977C|nr:sigma-54 dependent transcriptional regulator [Clostridium sp.]MBK5242783.1 sigma-54-dependent Fis family transcriptional regulator [Clostridium sp.]